MPTSTKINEHLMEVGNQANIYRKSIEPLPVHSTNIDRTSGIEDPMKIQRKAKTSTLNSTEFGKSNQNRKYNEKRVKGLLGGSMSLTSVCKFWPLPCSCSSFGKGCFCQAFSVGWVFRTFNEHRPTIRRPSIEPHGSQLDRIPIEINRTSIEEHQNQLKH